MSEFLRAAIPFAMANFTLTFLVAGLIVALVEIWRARDKMATGLVVEKLLANYLLFAIGLAFLYNFVMHSFFGEMSARFIGWQDSPFQFEVGVASLGFSIVALLAAYRSFEFRVAAIIGPGVFTLGAAAGHIREMIVAHNFAPGNAGVIFYTDILIPLAGFALLWLQYRFDRRELTQDSTASLLAARVA